MVRAFQEAGSVGAGMDQLWPLVWKAVSGPEAGGGALLRWDLEAEPVEIRPRPLGSNVPSLPFLLGAFFF